MPFADRLRELRTAKGLTQEELSKILKISQSSIAMYESGKREPKLETLEVFADYFNVDMNYITGKSSYTTKLGLSSPPSPSQPVPAPTTPAGSPAMDSSAPGGTQGSAEGADEGQGGTILMRAQNELDAEDLHQLELMAEHFLKRKLKGK